ncbi:MAG: hypothetical protein AAF415_10650 [Pseudomonadota bacterium]
MRYRPDQAIGSLAICLTCAATIAATLSASAGTEVWLDQGNVTLTLPSGKTVEMEPGTHAACDDDDCTLTPLALAPARPEGLQAAAQAAGGLAQAPLSGLGSVLPEVALPAIGVGAVAAGLALGLTSGSSTTSTTNTN